MGLNLGAIQKLIDAGTLTTDRTIDHAALQAAGVGRGGKDGVRILAKGAFSSALTFRVAGASAAAKAAVEAAGGSIEVIEVVSAADKAKAKKGVTLKAKKAARG